MSKKAVGHRRVQLDTAAAARACWQNAWPGMLLSDYDWAENGVLELARQIQSEYWGLVAYSLFTRRVREEHLELLVGGLVRYEDRAASA